MGRSWYQPGPGDEYKFGKFYKISTHRLQRWVAHLSPSSTLILWIPNVPSVQGTCAWVPAGASVPQTGSSILSPVQFLPFYSVQIPSPLVLYSVSVRTRKADERWTTTTTWNVIFHNWSDRHYFEVFRVLGVTWTIIRTELFHIDYVLTHVIAKCPVSDCTVVLLTQIP